MKKQHLTIILLICVAFGGFFAFTPSAAPTLADQLTLTDSQTNIINSYLKEFYSVEIGDDKDFEKVASTLMTDLDSKTDDVYNLLKKASKQGNSDVENFHNRIKMAPKNTSSQFRIAVYIDIMKKAITASHMYKDKKFELAKQQFFKLNKIKAELSESQSKFIKEAPSGAPLLKSMLHFACIEYVVFDTLIPPAKD